MRKRLFIVCDINKENWIQTSMAMSRDCAKGTESTMHNLIFLAERKAQDDDDIGRGEW